ncbi:MAG: hypothetical protein ACPGN3_14040 [Opitutales bacterium]
MKKSFAISALVAFSTLSLSADVKLYDGFKSSRERAGFVGPWRVSKGSVELTRSDLSLSGVDSEKGTLELSQDAISVSVIQGLQAEKVYGSFRVKAGAFTKGAMIGMSLAEQTIEEVRPDASRVSFQIKAYGSPLGATTTRGKKKEVKEGAGISAGEPSLVLFEIHNASAGQGTVTMWVLNAEQAKAHARSGFDIDTLNTAGLGAGLSQVSQRAQQPLGPTNPSLTEQGLMLCLFNRFNNNPVEFDEIRFSDSSLADAAGQ